jgi:hypothetical protein
MPGWLNPLPCHDSELRSCVMARALSAAGSCFGSEGAAKSPRA